MCSLHVHELLEIIFIYILKLAYLERICPIFPNIINKIDGTVRKQMVNHNLCIRSGSHLTAVKKFHSFSLKFDEFALIQK